MKKTAFNVRLLAMLLSLAFLFLVFSAVLFANHSCTHGHNCSICSHFSESNKSSFIPTITGAFALLLTSFLTLACTYFSIIVIKATPTMLKVKLSD